MSLAIVGQGDIEETEVGVAADLLEAGGGRGEGEGAPGGERIREASLTVHNAIFQWMIL